MDFDSKMRHPCRLLLALRLEQRHNPASHGTAGPHIHALLAATSAGLVAAPDVRPGGAAGGVAAKQRGVPTHSPQALVQIPRGAGVGVAWGRYRTSMLNQPLGSFDIRTIGNR